MDANGFKRILALATKLFKKSSSNLCATEYLHNYL